MESGAGKRQVSPDALDRARAALDRAHEGDPVRRTVDGREYPAERVWADTVLRWVRALEPEPSPVLELAARAQHLERWLHPRSAWPAGRAGYLRWRREAAVRQGERAAALCTGAGLPPEFGAAVARLVRKEGLGRDPETIVLEDAACLAFLELDLAAFSARHEEDDVVRILARSWRKLSPRGQETALALDLPPGLRVLLDRALAP
ncbi:MAG: DUF4202 domain-containing protein [Pseudomonadales bacterium]|jgi:hypothetical protein|nr:DUF4202 domain-containing protein [Pseudomonadales bacterium]